MARRRRLAVGAALAAVIVLGLASRSAMPVPDWVASHAGDALWAMAVYLGLALLWPNAASPRLLAASLALCLAVELSQRYQAPWLVELRRSLPGRLLLGQGWQWADLPRYAVGAGLAFVLDRLLAGRLAVRESGRESGQQPCGTAAPSARPRG